MNVLALTYSGSVLGLIGWLLVGVLYLAIAFTAGWFANEWKREARR